MSDLGPMPEPKAVEVCRFCGLVRPCEHDAENVRDVPFGYFRSLGGAVGSCAEPEEDEHCRGDDLRRANDEHPCRCAHHRETGDDR